MSLNFIYPANLVLYLITKWVSVGKTILLYKDFTFELSNYDQNFLNFGTAVNGGLINKFTKSIVRQMKITDLFCLRSLFCRQIYQMSF